MLYISVVIPFLSVVEISEWLLLIMTMIMILSISCAQEKMDVNLFVEVNAVIFKPNCFFKNKENSEKTR